MMKNTIKGTIIRLSRKGTIIARYANNFGIFMRVRLFDVSMVCLIYYGVVWSYKSEYFCLCQKTIVAWCWCTHEHYHIRKHY